MYSEISFIVLCYNDAGGIQRMIPILDQVLKTNFENYEIILVNDFSSDHSLQVAENFRSDYPHLIIISHQKNMGVGACFRTGFLNTKYKVIGYIDGDYQYDPNDIPNMMKYLTRYDSVSGIRVQRSDHWKRKVISRIYNFMINRLFSMKFKDVNSGLKLYKREFFIDGKSGSSTGAFYDAEILINGINHGKTVVEIPINHFFREYGIPGGASLTSICKTCHELLKPEMAQFRSNNISAKFIVFFIRIIPKY